jgi:5-methylcytosine-specific restriction protein B
VTILRAARTVLRDGLGRHDSAFSPGQPAWTRESVDELKRLFVNRPDVPGASFGEKLEIQLAEASDPARLLFAELYYLNRLPLSDYRGSQKRFAVNEILFKVTSTVTIPNELDEALDSGAFQGGIAFLIRRYWQLCLLVEFTRSFLDRSEPDQQVCLDDPLAFGDLLSTVTQFGEQRQRQSLLYLAHPQHYQPIARGKYPLTSTRGW